MDCIKKNLNMDYIKNYTIRLNEVVVCLVCHHIRSFEAMYDFLKPHRIKKIIASKF